MSNNYKDFPPTSLYAEDITEIVEFLKSHAKSVSISSGKYNLDPEESISALKEVYPDGRIPDLEIVASGPYISISIRGSTFSVYTSEESPISLAAIQKIGEISNRHKRPLFRPITDFSYLLFALPTGFFFASGAELYAAAFFLLSLLSAFLSSFVKIRDTYKLYAINRTELSSFFTRRKEEVVVSLISALAGGIISQALSYFFGKG